ncbi:MAG: hypothetical protein Q7T14_14100, partial [Aestuariivirga sp.]|nr:hypothetical protein [Aestuariivirga sp.]
GFKVETPAKERRFFLLTSRSARPCGEWTGRSAQHQFLLRPAPNKNWIDYILKDGSQQDWNPLAVTDNLLKASIEAHGRKGFCITNP